MSPADGGIESMGSIDIHSHYWPSGLIEAARNGGEWYGWRALSEADGKGIIAFGPRIAPFTAPPVDLGDPEARSRKRFDEQGIVFEAVMPVGFLWNYVLEGKQAAEYAREMNEEVAELEKKSDRYRGLGYLPLQNTDLALAELEYAVKELGLKSFAIGTNIEGKNIDDVTVLPVLEAVADAGASLNVHPPYWDKLGEERYQRYQFTRVFGALLEAGMAVGSLIYSGILDRKPDMRVGFTHGGGIINGAIGRLDLRYHGGRAVAAPMDRPPLDYMREFVYDCLVHDDQALKSLVERVGADHVMIGTDYPFDGDHPGGSANWIKQLDWLDDEQKEDILWRTAARHLDLPDFSPTAP